ncbi:class I SAM-dependent methyltransferase [Sphingomonas sp.]|uniref:class I SAM-dependent methyltransferase n=1 Tax=Sphingomonas sp. TaxID=28214 RepID=UPI0025FE2CC1|nr:class I SAM-dependent methyltransferase [Sphingomonas sp.]
MRYEFKPVSACNMCGSTDFRFLGMRLSASQGWTPRRAKGIAVPVKRCRACGLVFADPQPIPESLADHYGLPPDEYWIGEAQRHWTPAYLSDEIAEAKRLLDFTPGMKALDVGVGLGKGMRSLAAAGFDAWGIEPSPEFRDHAIAKFDVDPDRVALAAAETAEFPDGHFDFVTFGAVLEHLYDPALALDRAMRWLKPGGILHAEVPSSDYLMSRLLNLFFTLRGTNYVTNISPMHSPFHLYEFTLRSFRKYEVAHHGYMIGVTPHLPKLLTRPVEWLMAWSRTGMQLIVYLRR